MGPRRQRRGRIASGRGRTIDEFLGGMVYARCVSSWARTRRRGAGRLGLRQRQQQLRFERTTTAAAGRRRRRASGGGSVPGVTPTTITVGVVAGTSGPFAAPIKDFIEGFYVWQREVNAAGGIGGRQIEVKEYDHGETADGGVAACKAIVADKAVYVPSRSRARSPTSRRPTASTRPASPTWSGRPATTSSASGRTPTPRSPRPPSRVR